jgi:hypothetical protein
MNIRKALGLKPGDRGKITVKGSVLEAGDALTITVLGDQPEVEVTAPEPAYEDRAFYQDRYGEIFRYLTNNGDRPWMHHYSLTSAKSVAFDVPKRPLRKFVLE